MTLSIVIALALIIKPETFNGVPFFLLLDQLNEKVQYVWSDFLFFSLLYQWLEHFGLTGLSNKSCDKFVQTCAWCSQWCYHKHWKKTVSTFFKE